MAGRREAHQHFVYYGGTGYYDLAEYAAQIGLSLETSIGNAITASSPVTFATDGRITLAP